MSNDGPDDGIGECHGQKTLIMRNTRHGTLEHLLLGIRYLIWIQVIEDERQSIINYHKEWHRYSHFETKLKWVDGDLVLLTDVICKLGNYSHNQTSPKSLLAQFRTIFQTIEREIMPLLELALVRQETGLGP